MWINSTTVGSGIDTTTKSAFQLEWTDWFFWQFFSSSLDFFFLLFRLIIDLNLTLMQHFRGFRHWGPSSNQLFNSIELDSLQFCFRWSILDFILAVIRHLRRYLTAVYHSWFLNVTNIFENVISVVFSFGLSGLLRQLLKVFELLQSSFEFWNFFRNSLHYVHNVIGNK